jgi:hypothetical protein
VEPEHRAARPRTTEKNPRVSEEEDPAEDDSAADAPSSGVAQEAPAASSTSEGTNADTVVSTMPDVTDVGTNNASAANDNQPTDPLPVTGTE